MARSTSSPVAAPGTAIDAVPGRSLALDLLRSLRPAQWTKNLVVFAGLLFGKQLFDAAAGRRMRSRRSSIFCALSGVVYLVNDIADRESDRRHPLKARRPIASGALPVAAATGAALAIGAAALAAAYLVGPALRGRRRRLPRAADALFGAAQAHRHHRRADDRHRLRAARGRRRGGRARANQPLAARLHDSAGAVHRAGEAAARDRAARRRRHQPPADSRRIHARICSIR